MIPYEDELQKRIEDNTKRMKALNLPNLAQSLVKSSSATKKTSSHLRGTNGGGRTLSSRGRRSTGVVHVTPTLQSPQLSPNQSLVHAQPTPSPHINTSPTPSPHINTTPSQHINTMPTQSLPRNTTPTPSPHINTISLSSPLPTHTPTPTSTTSSTLPQNSEQTLPHTQSPAIEPDEDEEIDQECLLEIEPYGNEFNPSTAIRFLTKSINRFKRQTLLVRHLCKMNQMILLKPLMETMLIILGSIDEFGLVSLSFVLLFWG